MTLKIEIAKFLTGLTVIVKYQNIFNYPKVQRIELPRVEAWNLRKEISISFPVSYKLTVGECLKIFQMSRRESMEAHFVIPKIYEMIIK